MVVTNSKVKFVIVVDSSNTALQDNEIHSMFRKLHNSYMDVMCNPFYNPSDPIHSKTFDNMVLAMMVKVYRRNDLRLTLFPLIDCFVHSLI